MLTISESQLDILDAAMSEKGRLRRAENIVASAPESKARPEEALALADALVDAGLNNLLVADAAASALLARGHGIETLTPSGRATLADTRLPQRKRLRRVLTSLDAQALDAQGGTDRALVLPGERPRSDR